MPKVNNKISKKIKMPEKSFVIKDHIGIYDGYIPNDACDQAVKMFNHYKKFNKVFNRFHSEKTTPDKKNDTHLFVRPEFITDEDFGIDKLKLLMVNFDIALRNYYTETNIQNYISGQLKTDYVKIQRTIPTQGYHIWHVEHGDAVGSQKRVLVYSIYLNDVEDGGETEFLLQAQRVKPVKGRIVIWPAGYPYVHRGNPPLSGEKYLLTSWISYNSNT